MSFCLDILVSLFPSQFTLSSSTSSVFHFHPFSPVFYASYLPLNFPLTSAGALLVFRNFPAFSSFSLSRYLFLPIVLPLPKFPHTCIIPLSRCRVFSLFSLSFYFFRSSFLFSSSRSHLLLLSIISLPFLSHGLTLSFSFCLPPSVPLSTAISLSKFFSIPLSFS